MSEDQRLHILFSWQVMLLGEVVSKATVPYESIMREAVRAAGYDHEDMGMDCRTVNVPLPHLGHGHLVAGITLNGI